LEVLASILLLLVLASPVPVAVVVVMLVDLAAVPVVQVGAVEVRGLVPDLLAVHQIPVAVVVVLE
jgi:hypothetical protein